MMITVQNHYLPGTTAAVQIASVCRKGNQPGSGKKDFVNLTVRDNLMVGAYAVKQRSIPERLEEVYNLFPRLKERKNRWGGTLSGGEQDGSGARHDGIPS